MEKIAAIRDLLPRGAQKEIAQKLKTNVVQVNRVLNGHAYDIKIINAVADYYAAYKDKKDKAISRLAELID